MNPAILARLFQAQQQKSSPLTLEQEPGPLQWGTPDPMQARMQSIHDAPMPPSDYKYLDRVEGDDRPLGVMFDQVEGSPEGDPTNIPMGRLPPSAKEGQYISPLDIAPPPGPQSAAPAPAPPAMMGMFNDVQWGPNPYPAEPPPMPPMRSGRMSSRRRR